MQAERAGSGAESGAVLYVGAVGEPGPWLERRRWYVPPAWPSSPGAGGPLGHAGDDGRWVTDMLEHVDAESTRA